MTALCPSGGGDEWANFVLCRRPNLSRMDCVRPRQLETAGFIRGRRSLFLVPSTSSLLLVDPSFARVQHGERVQPRMTLSVIRGAHSRPSLDLHKQRRGGTRVGRDVALLSYPTHRGSRSGLAPLYPPLHLLWPPPQKPHFPFQCAVIGFPHLFHDHGGAASWVDREYGRYTPVVG